MGGEMSAAPTALNAVKAAAAGAVAWARAQFSKQAHIVGRLSDKAAEISSRIADQVKAQKDGPALGLFRLAGLQEKASRAVHMAAFLLLRLVAELRKSDSQIAEDLERARTEPQPEAAAPRQARDEKPADRLGRGGPERGGRLDDADQRAVDRLWRHVMTRPIDELIAEMCGILGLGPEWLREVEAEWEREQAASDQPEPDPKAMTARERLSYSSSSRALCPGPINTAVRSDLGRPPRPP
jgi:hypothetical protein